MTSGRSGVLTSQSSLLTLCNLHLILSIGCFAPKEGEYRLTGLEFETQCPIDDVDDTWDQGSFVFSERDVWGLYDLTDDGSFTIGVNAMDYYDDPPLEFTCSMDSGVAHRFSCVDQVWSVVDCVTANGEEHAGYTMQGDWSSRTHFRGEFAYDRQWIGIHPPYDVDCIYDCKTSWVFDADFYAEF